MLPASMHVLYDDNHVIAVYKPAGMLVQGDASGERTLMDEVKDWIAKKYQKPGKVFLGLVHRIDRRVQGVVVFARTSKAAARLSEQIRTRAVEKIYRAWVEGAIANDAAELVHFLSEDDGYVRVHDRTGTGRKEARLSYRVLKRERDRTYLEIALETGRKHQIRAQLGKIGHPILGDDRYGAKTPWPPPGIALWCYRMRFRHPTQDREISVELAPNLVG
jgi:23S rRNA pseudouridine1911/1915/1917 synthase